MFNLITHKIYFKNQEIGCVVKPSANVVSIVLDKYIQSKTNAKFVLTLRDYICDKTESKRATIDWF